MEGGIAASRLANRILFAAGSAIPPYRINRGGHATF